MKKCPLLTTMILMTFSACVFAKGPDSTKCAAFCSQKNQCQVLASKCPLSQRCQCKSS